MALRTFKDRRIGFFAGIKERVQTITVSGAANASAIATKITPYGVSVLVTTGTGGPHRIPLARPLGAGVHKTIVVKMNSSADVLVVNNSTLDKFYGSTVNSALFSSTSLKGQANLALVSVSTAQWAVLGVDGSTTLAGFPFAYANSSA